MIEKGRFSFILHFLAGEWTEKFCFAKSGNKAGFLREVSLQCLAFYALFGNDFSQKTKLPSYYNRDKKEGSCAQWFLMQTTTERAGWQIYGQRVNL